MADILPPTEGVSTSPTPYYEDESVSLFCEDSREFVHEIADASIDCVITDPPYSERTHKNATSNKAGERDHPLASGSARAFASWTDADLRDLLVQLGRVSRGWVIATLDYAHAAEFDKNPPEGLRVLRLGVWVKTNPTPQISGDRPAQGWESIAYMHRAGRKAIGVELDERYCEVIAKRLSQDTLFGGVA